MTLLIGLATNIAAWLAEKLFLSRFFAKPSAAQQAVNTQAKMAQDVADAPDRAQTVKELDNGTF